MGKSFTLARVLKFKTALLSSPTKRLKEEGRAFNDELDIVFIEDQSVSSKPIYWNIGADVSLLYKLNKYKIFAGVIFHNLFQNSKLPRCQI